MAMPKPAAAPSTKTVAIQLNGQPFYTLEKTRLDDYTLVRADGKRETGAWPEMFRRLVQELEGKLRSQMLEA